VSAGRQVDAENERAARAEALARIRNFAYVLEQMVAERSFPASTSTATIQAAAEDVSRAISALKSGE
jgi:hypothetical protein